MEGRFQYSTFVYNTYPWPENPTKQQTSHVDTAAQHVLSVRTKYLADGKSLADLYDPLSMPSDLLKAHQKLDTAVDRCYRKQAFTSERNRLKYLFALYEHYATGTEFQFDE